MLSGRLFRAALLLTSGLLAVVQANTKQLTSNLNFQSEEERGATSSFGYKANGKSWVIDSGAGLTVKVSQGSCDITSMIWNKAELQIKQKMTHINSGLGKVTSSIQELKDKTIQISSASSASLARLARKPMNNPMVTASNIDGMKPIEAHDVYADSKGVTASKFYSGIPFIDDRVHGVTGDAGGVYFVMSDYAYEKSVGGPFFRDINNQCTEANELTFYMFSDHTRTEDYRFGFHGPYALVFTDGKTPPTVSDVDFDFFQDLTLAGFVPEAERGSWTGSITDKNGVLSNSSVVVGFSNAEAQYWVKLNSTTGSFTSPMMIAGSYNATIYKNQLPVSSEAVTISGASGSTPASTKAAPETQTSHTPTPTHASYQGQSRRTQSVQNAQTLTVTYEPAAKPIWRIGKWDGTPDGFLNADKIHTAHPSDSRMEAWKPLNFTIGTDKDSIFPMAMFRAVNDPITINFELTKQQVGDRTLKIGVPLAQNSGRCRVTVNKYSAKVPLSAAVKTRGVTRGVTVGKYMFYDYAIPKSALVEGKNQVVLSIVSGNKDTLGKWLSASVVFDALELV
ncbi:Polysaccharide lyase [Phytophthora cinnamomi]|uniref:Polysaccharide lyase n=1 Tax=Phytophthora cinnamomi TaxID=4785 RepID=UPI00355AA9AF|nr:Polysaccharide lyase [Phytophthora cinnamomi]